MTFSSFQICAILIYFIDCSGNTLDNSKLLILNANINTTLMDEFSSVIILIRIHSFLIFLYRIYQDAIMTTHKCSRLKIGSANAKTSKHCICDDFLISVAINIKFIIK